MDVISPQEREIKRCKIAMVAQILRVTGQRSICDCNLSNVEEVENEK